MTRFTWNDIVKAADDAPKELRPGERAWIVGVSEAEDRRASYLGRFPDGTVYTIEFEDGSSVEVHEADLERSE